MNNIYKKLQLKINGTHCPSCEVLIERKFRNIPGVISVKVNHASGKAEIECNREIRMHEFQDVVKDHGYHVALWSDQADMACAMELSAKNTPRDYMEIGAVFLIVMALYLIFRQMDIIPAVGVDAGMSYGFVFALGLVAAVSSCLAVTGGLLVALAAKYNEANPHASGVSKFIPHLYFNLGRVVSYTVLGGLVGLLGSVLTFSPKVNGWITIIVSLVMIMLGFRLLKIFGWLKHFQPRMPKFLAHKLYDATGSAKGGTAFLLGGGTFFLPCGFTQALQLYVLSQGDFLTGALTMLFFSLGTLPSLISLGLVSSFVKGVIQKYFIKFAGVLVLILGFVNINNGLVLTGNNFSLAEIFSDDGTVSTEDPNVKLVDGKQLVEMKVVGLSYDPDSFTIKKNIPVEWKIDGSRAQGCSQVMLIPDLGISEYLSPRGITTIDFTAEKAGRLRFMCGMGMIFGKFNVVD